MIICNTQPHPTPGQIADGVEGLPQKPNLMLTTEPWEHAVSASDSETAKTLSYEANALVAGMESHAVTYGMRANAHAAGHVATATTHGPQAHACATGVNSCAETNGRDAVAVSIGVDGRARAITGGAIVLTYCDADGAIVHIRASRVGEHGIRPNTWYRLNLDGEFEEAAPL